MNRTDHRARFRAACYGALCALAVTACSDGPYELPDYVDEGAPQAGERHWPLSDFTNVTLIGDGDLFITQASRPALMGIGQHNELAEARASVHDGELRIWAPKMRAAGAPRFEFHLAVTSLEGISLVGGGNIVAQGIESESLVVRLPGPGSIELAELDTQQLQILNNGTGSVSAAGTVDRQRIELASLGGYDGRYMDSAETAVLLTSSGSATVCVRDRLEVVITGSGTVRYIGDPVVTSRITGAGGVVRDDG